jgi:hypothetical protein
MERDFRSYLHKMVFHIHISIHCCREICNWLDSNVGLFVFHWILGDRIGQFSASTKFVILQCGYHTYILKGRIKRKPTVSFIREGSKRNRRFPL